MRPRTRILQVLLAAFSLFFASAHTVEPAEFTIKRVVLSGDVAPEGGSFITTSTFSINNLGAIAFVGRSSFSTGVYQATGGTITRLVKPGDPMIVTCSLVTRALTGPSGFGQLFMNDLGDIVFHEGSFFGTLGDPVLFSGGTLTNLVMCPNLKRNVRFFSASAFALNNAGTVLLDRVTFDLGRQFFLIDGQNATLFPLIGTSAPGGGTIVGAFIPTINDSGQVLVNFATAFSSGLFISPGGPGIPVALSGGPAPGGQTFRRFRGPGADINNAGEVVFIAELSDSRWVIFRRALDGTLTTLVRQGDATPRGDPFGILGDLTRIRVDINDKGDVAFGSNNGLFFLSAEGVLSKVVRPGDEAPGGGTFITAGSALKLNNKREIAFFSRLSTDERGIFLASPGGLEIEFLDPVPDLLVELTLTPDEAKAKLAQKAETVDGVAADGVARVAVRVTAPEPGTIELALVDDAGMPLAPPEEAGFLTQLGEAMGSDSVSVPTVDVPEKGPMAFAIYRAPRRFVRAGSPDTNAKDRQISLRARFIPQTGAAAQEATTPIKIARPPLVLIHGLWSNSELAWDEFRANLQQTLPGIHIVAVDYERTNASRFSINRLVPLTAINQAKDQLRKEKIAVVQVDVFGHSMGGILSRIWAGDSMYKRRENFNEGDINKLVTVDSPHFGSILGELTVAFLATRDPIERLVLLETARVAGFPLDQGALPDLGRLSPALAAMRAVPIDLPSHAVIGDFVVTVDLDQVPTREGDFFRILKFFGFDTSVDVIPGSSDLVVSATSQAGELTPPTASTFNHVHTGATSNPDVILKAFEILNASLDDPVFAPGFPTD